MFKCFNFQIERKEERMKSFSISDSKEENAIFRKSPSIKMYKLFFILWIWINLFGEVKPVKPIFDLANNMRLVSLSVIYGLSNPFKKPSHVSNEFVSCKNVRKIA
jgi:hypothetical protein